MFSTFSGVIFKLFSRCHFHNQNMFAQKRGNCINSSGVLHVGVSYLNLISVIRKLSPEFHFNGHCTKTYRDFRNFNREDFRNDISWITSDLRKTTSYPNITKQKFIQSNDPQDWAAYKTFRCNKKGNVKSTKSLYYSNAFIQSNSNSRKNLAYMINKLTPHQKNNRELKQGR